MSWFKRLKDALFRTRSNIAEADLSRMSLEDLEFALIAADVGAKAATEIIEEVKRSPKSLGEALAEALTLQLEPDSFRAKIRKAGFTPDAKKSTVEPAGHVILVVGINGVGKTTTIAKLGRYYQETGRSVMFAAGDTFRAAAEAQLGIWGDRLDIPVVSGPDGADPAAVAFDAAAARKARGTDLLIVDTAGRLHTKHNLMEELKKVKRTIDKADPGEPKDIWLILDAVTGQNGLMQAKKFHEAVNLTGVIVTKLDSTAKGGIVVPIVRELGVPLKFIGIGEQQNDLQPFDAKEFVDALFN